MKKLSIISDVTRSALTNIVSGRNNTTTVSLRPSRKYAMGWASRSWTFSSPLFVEFEQEAK